MDLFLIVMLMFTGVAFGAGVGHTIPNATEATIIVFASFGGLGGAIIGCSFLAVAKSTEKRSRVQKNEARPHATTIHKPTSFRTRLAHFVSKSEDDVMNSNHGFRSSMPFWLAVDRLFHVPPKPAAMIRLILMRIRHALRG